MKKSLINISVNLKKTSAADTKSEILALGIFEDGLKKSKLAAEIDKKLGGSISKLIKLGDFAGRKLSSASLYTEGKIKADRLILIGLGKKKECDINLLRKASSLACKIAVDIKCSTVTLALHQDVKKNDPQELGRAIAEGVFFGAYRYDEYIMSNKNDRPKKITASVLDDTADSAKITKGIKEGVIIGTSQNISRTLSNRPPNVVYPEALAREAKKIASKTAGLSCQVFKYAQLKQKGMGGIVAVGQGAENKPAMIVIKYTPSKSKKTEAAPVALVGKAVTFDSGGISLKPGKGMEVMKMDMTGGASVLGAIKAIAELKLPVPVYAIICAAENKPGSGSYRPGDIITTLSGKTVEILNTDAEGRMCLCDGIHYAKTLKCKTIIDICTLTGACFVALGAHKAGLMSNSDKMIDQLKKASTDCDEPVWHLPSGGEYTEEMRSKVADLKNLGSTPYGGASRAASFLGEFAGETSWAHLDIASKMQASEPLGKIATSGSIGFGVKIMTRFVENLTK